MKQFSVVLLLFISIYSFSEDTTKVSLLNINKDLLNGSWLIHKDTVEIKFNNDSVGFFYHKNRLPTMFIIRIINDKCCVVYPIQLGGEAIFDIINLNEKKFVLFNRRYKKRIKYRRVLTVQS